MPSDILIALVAVAFLVIVFLWAYVTDRRPCQRAERFGGIAGERQAMKELPSCGIPPQSAIERTTTTPAAKAAMKCGSLRHD
jgi:hypothetical protein